MAGGRFHGAFERTLTPLNGRNRVEIITLPDAQVEPAQEHKSNPIRRLYFELFRGNASPAALDKARSYLEEQLQATATVSSDLPEDANALDTWFSDNVEHVGARYRDYLKARKVGDSRQYFENRSHALYFLKSVASTKMVDGAWLYGLLPRWQDTRFSALIRIYLEELGEGVPEKNHVVLYKKLLATHGCDGWDDLADSHYVQGVLQLALAYHAERFLPEVIGFNLGYEQLPLHLPITAYELNELGIDPYYFTLHVTVDNADTGHAKRAVESLFDALPRVGDAAAFYRRVQAGYRLNMLGASTTSVIADFDLEKELIEIFAKKGTVGQHAHSDYCRVGGRTINDWLAEPSQVPQFLTALEQGGWFKRHQDPHQSRFWKLIQSEKAEMFGVFSPYEQQVIYDWIAGNATGAGAADANAVGMQRRLMTWKARQRLLDTHESSQPSAAAAQARGIIRRHSPSDNADNDFNSELRLLEERLASSPSREAAMSMLAELMSPAGHHTAPGLMATRVFTKMLA